MGSEGLSLRCPWAGRKAKDTALQYKICSHTDLDVYWLTRQVSTSSFPRGTRKVASEGLSQRCPWAGSKAKDTSRTACGALQYKIYSHTDLDVHSLTRRFQRLVSPCDPEGGLKVLICS